MKEKNLMISLATLFVVGVYSTVGVIIDRVIEMLKGEYFNSALCVLTVVVVWFLAKYNYEKYQEEQSEKEEEEP